jgi:SRSO17 transposase
VARTPHPCREVPSRCSGSHQLLIHRNRTTGELAYYRCYSPHSVPLTTLVKVAGSRWRAQEFLQSGKGLAGPDEHQARRFASWSRWVTLSMLAHAFPAVVRADEHARHPASDVLILLTCDEIQRLFTTLVIRPVQDAAHRLH